VVGVSLPSKLKLKRAGSRLQVDDITAVVCIVTGAAA